MILGAADARRVLAESPGPFATETRENRAALAHFELQALEPNRPVHHLGEAFLAAAKSEAEQIDAESGAFLGNYPQAFSHIGVIASGFNLARLFARKGGR